MTSRLSAGTEQWLVELTGEVPDDLLDPKELEKSETPRAVPSDPSDPFLEKLEDIYFNLRQDRPDDLDNDVNVPFSARDAELLQSVTEQQSPKPSKRPKQAKRPKQPKRSRVTRSPGASAAREPARVGAGAGAGAGAGRLSWEPRGYAASYDDFSELESDESAPQTGEWENNVDKVLYSAEEKRRVRLLKKAALERLRRARMKKKKAQMELRF